MSNKREIAKIAREIKSIKAQLTKSALTWESDEVTLMPSDIRKTGWEITKGDGMEDWYFDITVSQKNPITGELISVEFDAKYVTGGDHKGYGKITIYADGRQIFKSRTAGFLDIDEVPSFLEQLNENWQQLSNKPMWKPDYGDILYY